MAASIIRVEFPRSEVSAADAGRVRALAREAASGLGALLSRPTRVLVGDGGRFASAAVVGVEPYHLRITAGVYDDLPRRPLDAPAAEWRERRLAAPRSIGVDVSASVEWLRSPFAHEIVGDFSREYVFSHAQGVSSAVEWVSVNCLIDPVPRVSAGEMLEWASRRVTLRGESDSLLRAVVDFGTAFGESLTVDVLRERYGMSIDDARAVVQGIRKFLAPLRRPGSERGGGIA